MTDESRALLQETLKSMRKSRQSGAIAVSYKGGVIQEIKQLRIKEGAKAEANIIFKREGHEGI